MTNILKILFGVPQSQYAAIAFIISCIVCTTIIIINNNNMALYDKFIIIFIAFIISLPGVALTFLQLTCIVTGAGANNTRWWCNIYAWVLSIIIIFYAICLIVSVFIPIIKYRFNDKSIDKSNDKSTDKSNDKSTDKSNNKYKDTFADIDIVNNLIKTSSSNINVGNTGNLVGTSGNLGNAGNTSAIGATDSNLLAFEYNDQLTFADILNNSR